MCHREFPFWGVRPAAGQALTAARDVSRMAACGCAASPPDRRVAISLPLRRLAPVDGSPNKVPDLSPCA